MMNLHLVNSYTQHAVNRNAVPSTYVFENLDGLTHPEYYRFNRRLNRVNLKVTIPLYMKGLYTRLLKQYYESYYKEELWTQMRK